MNTKSLKKSEKNAEARPGKSKPEEKTQRPGDAEKPDGTMDYGGFPERDLKKNLGCG